MTAGGAGRPAVSGAIRCVSAPYGVRMSSIGDVFPHDDTVARFVVAMSIARNDIRHALKEAGRANDADDPQFGYWVRIATGHFFEAADALGHWRKVDEVKKFIATLPKDGRDAMRDASSAIQKMGKGVLEHSRNRTFHYPYPTSQYQTDEELEQALKGLAKVEARLVVESVDPGLFRLQFADEVAAALALGKHDPKKIREQLTIARDGAVGFVNFATRVWEKYQEIHGLELGDPVSNESS
jgi:hypothetical protein